MGVDDDDECQVVSMLLVGPWHGPRLAAVRCIWTWPTGNFCV